MLNIHFYTFKLPRFHNHNCSIFLHHSIFLLPFLLQLCFASTLVRDLPANNAKIKALIRRVLSEDDEEQPEDAMRILTGTYAAMRFKFEGKVRVC